MTNSGVPIPQRSVDAAADSNQGDIECQRSLQQAVLLSLRNRLFKSKCTYYHRRNRLFDQQAHTSDIHWVDPDDITYITRYAGQLEYGHPYLDAGAFDKFERTGAVVGGTWDRLTVEFSELYIYQALDNHFNREVPWTETTFFNETLEAIESGTRPWGCRSRDDLEQRCKDISRLYERIERTGYKSQRDLGKHPVDEVNVNIGRYGDLLFNDGRHRLSIAKLLNIDEIPVRILAVHEQYLD